MIEGYEIVIDLDYKVLRFFIIFIEYFFYRIRLGIIVVKFKVRSKGIKWIFCLSDEKEIIRFDCYINGKIIDLYGKFIYFIGKLWLVKKEVKLWDWKVNM